MHKGIALQYLEFENWELKFIWNLSFGIWDLGAESCFNKTLQIPRFLWTHQNLPPR